MRLFLDAILVSAAMMAIYFCIFFLVFLLAEILTPVENKLSEFIWKHFDHDEQNVVTKQTFKQFSQRHR
jgi:hypothetical protein